MNSMSRRLVVLALVLVLAFVLVRVLDLDAHAAIISGMPISNASYVLGPLAVLVVVATPIVAPICALAVLLLEVSRRLSSRRRARRESVPT